MLGTVATANRAALSGHQLVFGCRRSAPLLSICRHALHSSRRICRPGIQRFAIKRVNYHKQKTIQINYQPVYLYRYRSILSNSGKLRRTSLGGRKVVHRLAAQLPIFQPQHVVGFPEVNLPIGGAFVGTV